MKPGTLAVIVLFTLVLGAVAYRHQIGTDQRQALRDALTGDKNFDTNVGKFLDPSSDKTVLPGTGVSQLEPVPPETSGAPAGNYKCTKPQLTILADQVGDCGDTKEANQGLPYVVDDKGNIFKNEGGGCKGQPDFIGCKLESKTAYFLHAEARPLVANWVVRMVKGSDQPLQVSEGGKVYFAVEYMVRNYHGSSESIEVSLKPSWKKKGLFGKEREAGYFILSARSSATGNDSQKIACGEMGHFKMSSISVTSVELLVKLECRRQ